MGKRGRPHSDAASQKRMSRPKSLTPWARSPFYVNISRFRFAAEADADAYVLIDKKNHVRADTAALALDSREWADIAVKGRSNRVTFAIRAAKLLDERHGRACRAYGFTPFATADTDGYFVFDCDTPSRRL
jgi:hypothetical protein